MNTETFSVLVAAVMGLTELIKKMGLKSKYAPITALVLGLGGSLLVGGTWQSIIFNGVIIGLTASGFYSGAKAVASKDTTKEIAPEA